MSQILDLMRPGDVPTHAHSGAPNIGGAFTNIVQDGKLLLAALAAKQRGVLFVGHGAVSILRWRKSRSPAAARRTPSLPTFTSSR